MPSITNQKGGHSLANMLSYRMETSVKKLQQPNQLATVGLIKLIKLFIQIEQKYTNSNQHCKYTKNI